MAPRARKCFTGGASFCFLECFASLPLNQRLRNPLPGASFSEYVLFFSVYICAKDPLLIFRLSLFVQIICHKNPDIFLISWNVFN